MQQQGLSTFEEKINYIENYLLSRYGDTPDRLRDLKHRFSYFKTAINKKWSQARRTEGIFLKNNEARLEGMFYKPNNVTALK